MISALSIIFFLLHYLFPLPDKIPYSTLILDSKQEVLYASLASDDRWRMKTEANEIPDSLTNAFLFKEDQYFYWHPGINPAAIVRALWNNSWQGKRTSGASTITMQVARLLEPKPRTIGAKLIEAFRALQLEYTYSKEEILLLYFNLVPYGGNIEGIKSASVLYFNKLPQRLSISELTLLTIIPNRPTSLSPGKNEALLLSSRNSWLRAFREHHIFSEEAIESALQEPIVMKRLPAPRKVPHLAYRLLKQYPGSTQLQTHIKSSIQASVEELAYNYTQRMKSKRIYNASVLVIDNKSRQVIAYLGSSDFQDHQNGGQINGIRALRSPGSTLKPLIYGIGMDEGLVTPKTIFNDVPTDFNGFAPQNFDNTFHGKVSLEEALAYSLNIPAVKMLQQIGVPTLSARLKKAGFRKLAQQNDYLGLSMALGGCSVTLEELCGLYAALARKGQWAPLQTTTRDTSTSQYPILSASSAYMITGILASIERPDLPNGAESNFHIPKIAWKTGTSYGRKDAWSIGYNQRFTIGVWLGNFSGHGVHELSGADVATPLLFQVFNALDYNSSSAWYAAPGELRTRYVCTESGLPSGEFCSHTSLDFFLPGISPALRCEHLQYIMTDEKEHISYCHQCAPENGYKKKLYPVLAPELANFYRKEKIPFQEIPPHNPSCQRVLNDQAPRITSPLHKKEYLIEKDDPSPLALRCETQHQVREVYWYINDAFYQKASPSETVFFAPATSSIKISCVDDQGRNANCSIVVKFY
ncbi:MAG: penicillin-binding protein 1C [Cytophagaceae bacterium]|nr:penicillin-binding protein 1C [Cytophagaceae bacterium]